jgi:DNA replication licensing factor MCM6
MIFCFQDNYLIEIRGDVQDSLASAGDDASIAQDSDARIFYMVHPSVDADESSTA